MSPSARAVVATTVPPRARVLAPSGAPTFAVRALRRLAIVLAVVAVTWAMLWLLDALIRRPDAADAPIDALVTASLTGLAVLGYIGWPSRWNIPAHMQLAFAITAYLLPTVLGTSFSVVPRSVFGLYAAIVIVGLAASIVGAVIGAELPVPRWADVRTYLGRVPLDRIARRVLVVTVVSAIVLAGTFLVMGLVPAFANTDPLNAKFFRGAYAARYAPIALYYRGSVAVLGILMPLLAAYAIWRRRWYWFAAVIASVVLLVCTLMRGNAAAGLLLFAGIALARLRRRIFVYLFIAALVIVYGFGSASWVLLRALGLGAFGPAMNLSDIGAVVGAGAPDVSDHLQFLAAWLAHPVYTLGRTFYGGLLPSHYTWNPAVWTLMVEQPGTPLSEISSGGLRLPGPLWGYVSFGWIGVVAVSALSGLVLGFAGAAVRRVVELDSREQVVLGVVLYASIIDVLGQFYTLNYSSVFELLLLFAILLAPRWLPARLRPPGRADR